MIVDPSIAGKRVVGNAPSGVFWSGFEVLELSVDNGNGEDDGLTADLAVLDVLLIPRRAVDGGRKGLAAIGAVDGGPLKHGWPRHLGR